jgi:hypothetical protein
MRAFLPTLLALASSACADFGHAIDRPTGHTLVENLGDSRYIYRFERMTDAAPRKPASVAAIPPPGARNIAIVEVVVGYGQPASGFPDGVRHREFEFYPLLGKLAGELGGTHFVILRVARSHAWISGLTVAVIAT